MRRRHGKGNWWFASGGGAECDVTREEAALRELVEETGSTDVELGPVLWQRDLLLPFAGRRWDQDEWYELARHCDLGIPCAGLLETPAGRALDRIAQRLLDGLDSTEEAPR